MWGQRKGLLMLVAVAVLVVLAGVFFRDADTQLAVPSTTSTPSEVGHSPRRPGPSLPSPSLPSRDADGLPTVALADLPPEAQEVHRTLMATGTFDHDKDGTVFGNREGLLPARANGYYREFTVETPGSADRGARRLVVGGCGRQTSTRPVRATSCSASNPIYYTDDHYQSFRRVV